MALVMGRLVRTMLFPAVAWATFPVDFRVFWLSAVAAIGVGVLVGVVPALQVTRPNLTAALKSGTRQSGDLHGALRNVLTISQAAMAAALLVGAGLFTTSLWKVTPLSRRPQPERVLD